MRLTSVVLSNRHRSHLFDGCLQELYAHIFIQGRNYGIESFTPLRIGNVSCLSQGRQDGIEFARSKGSTHLLMIDDDMFFPSDAVQRLSARNVAVVGVNYVARLEKLQYTATDLSGNRLSSKNRQGIEKVSTIGMGLVLLKMGALDYIPPPYFEVIWDAMQQKYMPEDIYFCKKLREHNVDIYLDHDLSQKIGHIGDYIYRFNSFKE